MKKSSMAVDEHGQKEYLVTAGEMKCYDNNTISHFGISALVLMERAALAATEEIMKRTAPGQRVLIAAGCGNNGGDGIAVGRMLMLNGYKTCVCLVGDRRKCSRETERQLQIIENYGCPVQSKIDEEEYDIVVDALFGIGLSRKLEDCFAQAVESINQKHAFVCALDIPSGIHADTGLVMGNAVKADLTVTFAFKKLGHVLYPGCEYAGEVVCRDIGITAESFLGRRPLVYTYQEDACRLLPKRKSSGNKGTFGKVLIIAGSVNMSGACELCAKSAYRIGAGLVRVVTPEANRCIIQQDVPEALLMTYFPRLSEEKFTAGTKPELLEAFQWADCIALGPGLGKSPEARLLLTWAVTETRKPLVLDADGINLLAESDELKQYLENGRRAGSEIERSMDSEGKAQAGQQMIMTPHVGEFARLAACSTAQVKQDMLGKVKEMADRYRCVMVCKDARTAAAFCNKEERYLNINGNDGMATAGMGDVLTGIIAGLLAQGMSVQEAAVFGVYLHAAAGDIAAKEWGRHGLMAQDVVDALRKITGDAGKERE